MLAADCVVVANQRSRTLTVLARGPDGLVLTHAADVPEEPTFVHML